jgi:hypothetical protein
VCGAKGFVPIAGNWHNPWTRQKNIKARNHGEGSHFSPVARNLEQLVTVQGPIRFLTLGFIVLQP